MIKEENHSFLNYEKAIINFIFSFSWNLVDNSFDEIASDLKNNNACEWESQPLYQRQLWWINDNLKASYHPTIVSDNMRVLHKRGTIEDSLKVKAPFKVKDASAVSYKEVIASLNYDIRLYENGTGTCNFSFLSNSNNQIDFEKIMLLQHLATTVSYWNTDDDDESHLMNQKHLTHSKLEVTSKMKEQFGINKDSIFLAEFFSILINSLGEIKNIIWDERKLNSHTTNSIDDNQKQDWQNPYVISILQVSSEDLKKIFSDQDRLTTKEIGAIACRFNYDNGASAENYFRTLRREYIYNSLGFYINPQDEDHPHKVRLRNYSHSTNLFYTYGRRGAVAITSDFEMHPSYFAIPTFVNIIEILRSRWHLGTFTNLKLDETFEKIAHTEDIDGLINEIFKCRTLYGLFLQNPTPYLFDSGAVTEISDSAEEVFWLSKIASELERKLLAVDKLMEVIYAKRRLQKFGLNG